MQINNKNSLVDVFNDYVALYDDPYVKIAYTRDFDRYALDTLKLKRRDYDNAYQTLLDKGVFYESTNREILMYFKGHDT